MENQNTKAGEVQFLYKTKVKALDRPTIKTSIEAFKIFNENYNFEIMS